MTTLGVLSDTHIPDRVAELDARILQTFKHVGVTAILHAGDVSVPKVLDELSQIAPVHAVRGNRDIFYLMKLPLHVQLEFEGFKIGLAHGHGSFSRYPVDKIHRSIHGRLVERYLKRMLGAFTEVDVIVFGHLHVPCNLHLEGKLLFNPGSTCYPWPRGSIPTYGLLHLERGKEPVGEIIELE
jgi:hypothetical protein